MIFLVRTGRACRRRAVAWLLPALLVAPLAGCVDTRPRAELLLRWGGSPESLTTYAPSVLADDGTGPRIVSYTTPDASDQVVLSPVYETRTSGTLALDVSLGSIGTPLVRGTIVLPLRPDWRWRVDAYVASSRSPRQCIDCTGRRAFAWVNPHDGSSDTLYVAWNGARLSAGPVY